MKEHTSFFLCCLAFSFLPKRVNWSSGFFCLAATSFRTCPWIIIFIATWCFVGHFLCGKFSFLFYTITTTWCFVFHFCFFLLVLRHVVCCRVCVVSLRLLLRGLRVLVCESMCSWFILFDSRFPSRFPTKNKKKNFFFEMAENIRYYYTTIYICNTHTHCSEIILHVYVL